MSFYTAKEAANIANNRSDVLKEINRIEEAIMTDAAAGKKQSTIGPGSSPPIITGFSVSSTHYNSYADPLNNQTDAYNVARSQMNEVIGHFQKLNYNAATDIFLKTIALNNQPPGSPYYDLKHFL